MRKIISYNVNGIRAAIRKGFLDWLSAADPDVALIQEIKAQPGQISKEIEALRHLGYHTYLFPAEKKGYSGTAILTKEEPQHVEYGMGMETYDKEGRVLRADYEDVQIMSVYMPSGTSGDIRQEFKFQWLDDFFQYANGLKAQKPNLVIGGDVNICHKEIDIHNPKANKNTSGFLPEEREWMSKWLNSGWVDTFRYFNSEPHQYTWWSYRARARPKNLGWRIDYQFVPEHMEDRLKRAAILSEAKHSDHAPILLEIE